MILSSKKKLINLKLIKNPAWHSSFTFWYHPWCNRRKQKKKEKIRYFFIGGTEGIRSSYKEKKNPGRYTAYYTTVYHSLHPWVSLDLRNLHYWWKRVLHGNSIYPEIIWITQWQGTGLLAKTQRSNLGLNIFHCVGKNYSTLISTYLIESQLCELIWIHTVFYIF